MAAPWEAARYRSREPRPPGTCPLRLYAVTLRWLPASAPSLLPTPDHARLPPQRCPSWTLWSAGIPSPPPSLYTSCHQVPPRTWLCHLKILKSASFWKDEAPRKEWHLSSQSEITDCSWKQWGPLHDKDILKGGPAVRLTSQLLIYQCCYDFKGRSNSKHWFPFWFLWEKAM